MQNTACFLFSVTMTLTEAGLEAGPGMGLAAVALAFQVRGVNCTERTLSGRSAEGERRSHARYPHIISTPHVGLIDDQSHGPRPQPWNQLWVGE